MTPFSITVRGSSDLREALAADGRFALVDSPAAAQAMIIGEDDRSGDRLHAVRKEAAKCGVRLIPALLQRHQPAIRTAQAAAASGRIGLPWHVQGDFVAAAGTGAGGRADVDALLASAVEPVDVVLRLAGLPIRQVMTRAAGVGAPRALTLHCRHDNGVTSTVVVAAGGDGIRRRRYRVSGSHGVLLADATLPRLVITGREGTRHAWGGLRAVDRWMDALVVELARDREAPEVAELQGVDEVLRAAHASLDTGVTVQVKALRQAQGA